MNKKKKHHSLAIFIFYTILLIIGSLYPRLSEHYQTGEISSGLMPKEGDNFKMVNQATVYRLEEGKRRQYKNSTSFFSDKRNKPYDTPYEEGGILICDKAVVLSFPMGDYMPEKANEIGETYVPKDPWKVLKEGLFRSDKIGHFFAYLFFAILFFVVLQQKTMWSFMYCGIIILLTGTVLGAIIEWIQLTFVPGRDSELLDLLFNSIGLLIGLYIVSKQERK